MRVARKCQECRKLKSRIDFPKDNSHEGFGPWCNDCLFTKPELNKLYNNQISKTMPTLKEKREAEAAAKAAANVSAPVAETSKDKKADTAKPAATKPLPKTGDKTAKGDTVVGEKPANQGRGRKAQPEKPIELLDKEGKVVVGTFETVAEVAKHLDCTSAYIVDGLRGWTASVKGHKIRYKGEEIFVRERKPKSEAEKTFKEGAPKPKSKKDATLVVEDVPVPGDLDYDPELHAPKEEVEEDILDAPEVESVE